MNPFRQVKKPCSSPIGCGREVMTTVKVQRPMCRPCRRRLRNLKLSPTHAVARRREVDAAYWRGFEAGRAAALPSEVTR